LGEKRKLPPGGVKMGSAIFILFFSAPHPALKDWFVCKVDAWGIWSQASCAPPYIAAFHVLAAARPPVVFAKQSSRVNYLLIPLNF